MKKFFISLFPVLVLATGCVSGTGTIGTVGNTTYYSVREKSLSGPNISMIVSLQEGNPTPKTESQAAGPGIGQAAVNGLANVGSAVVFGGAIRPPVTSATTTVTTSANGTGGFVPPGQINNPGNGH